MKDAVRPIRNSAKALIIRDGKMLAVKMRDADGLFYIMPGGGQESEEKLSDAVVREVREELGIEVKCGELLFVIEGVYGEKFHRVDLVFECEYIRELPNAARHYDTSQIGCEWLDIERLNTLPLYPSKLRRQIMNCHTGRPYARYLGDESMGDPEVTE